MRTDELDYDLPEGAIAQVPIEPRDAARLLVDRGPGRDPEHRTVAELPELVRPGDLLVLNDTRVLPARVPIERASGGTGEVLLLEERDDGWWEVLCRPARKLRPGDVVDATAGGLRFDIGPDVGDGAPPSGAARRHGVGVPPLALRVSAPEVAMRSWPPSLPVRKPLKSVLM